MFSLVMCPDTFPFIKPTHGDFGFLFKQVLQGRHLRERGLEYTVAPFTFKTV